MAGSVPKPFAVAGQAPPNVGADALDALIWQSSAFGGTTDLLAVASSALGGALLWNPAASGVTLFVYGLQVGADAAATARAGLVTTGAVPASYVTTGTQIQPKHLQTGGSGLRAASGVLYQNVAAAALTAFMDAWPLAAGVTFQPFGAFANVVLRPATGLIVVVGGPAAAWHAAVSFDWTEYSVV